MMGQRNSNEIRLRYFTVALKLAVDLRPRLELKN